MPADTESRLKWLNDRDLLADLRRIVYFVPGQGREDVVHDTCVAAIEGRDAPDEHPRFKAWVKGIAYRQGQLWFRTQGRDPHIVMAPEDIDELRANAIDVHEFLETEEREQRAVEAVEQYFEGDSRLREVFAPLLGEDEGMSFRDKARSLGISEAALRKRWSRTRMALAAAVSAACAAAIAVLVTGYVVRKELREREDEAMIRPDLSSGRPAMGSGGSAGSAIRLLALESCRQGKWEKCIERLDDVNELRGTGDDAEMRAAREKAEAGKVKAMEELKRGKAPDLEGEGK